ncbi:adenylate cyclase [Parabacteroides sp. PF5-5]|uniref:CYTH domain-containing protein n=1 Tax=unclassified Parabacteroides TaxID=2649774 RepID=UPI002476A8B5|nr:MULTISPECIES: CYTH domain-containing protein [unclassified Parabacteroides]MDH6305252.1 adenylate cyclase [Parabacteroides sp. PH5-39]MDH6316605.1 adenylate cyclase [Parabacteroides sp. PF5-13]MDH6320215.1 adenylate cyclase [Parabacteroides sp. PH5-13]MDH6323842.1 adenylate cyclase [Parabacteroides sp. PH5-8]MDH6327892.1 adenylate cyclase [Parabacteroides sp. PH5-41]
MAIETERKFTVIGDFSKQATSAKRITQGYICADQGRTVRVRISGDDAFLTIKGPSDEKFWSRYEFEQQIPLADGEELMKLCVSGIIDKVRHYVPVGNHTWEVDVFHGENEGLVIAEIELTSEDETFEMPDWAGKEVSLDRRYYNSMLSRTPYSQWKDQL